MTLIKKSPKPFLCLLCLFCAALFLNGCTHHSHVLQNKRLSADRLQGARWFYSKNLLDLTDVKSFDVYSEQNTLHVVVAGVVDKKTPQRVYYLRSDNGGITWSKPLPINTQNAAPIASRGNDIQIAAMDNRVTVLWQTQGEFPNQGPIASVYSDDAGKTWNVGDYPAGSTANDQAHTDLISDQHGNIHAVWLEDPEERGYQSVRYARSLTGGQTWENAATLDESTCSCCWNSLNIAADGAINLLYRDMEPRDMALLQSKDVGKTWQRISTVGAFNWQFEGCPHIGGGIAESLSGVLHSLVWTGQENKQGLYYLRSNDHGHHWNMPKLLSKQALHGDIAADSQSVTAVWDEKGPEGLSIVGSNSNDDGKSWSPVINFSKSGAIASHPRVVHTQAGILVLWTEKVPKQSTQWVMLLVQ